MLSLYADGQRERTLIKSLYIYISSFVEVKNCRQGETDDMIVYVSWLLLFT